MILLACSDIREVKSQQTLQTLIKEK